MTLEIQTPSRMWRWEAVPPEPITDVVDAADFLAMDAHCSEQGVCVESGNAGPSSVEVRAGRLRVTSFEVV